MRFAVRPLGAAVLLSCALAAPAHATTFTVSKTSDTSDGACDADCSLREAVIAANANPGPDTITLGGGTYQLSLDGNDDAAEVGDLDVTDPLTIAGAGIDATRVAGDFQDRVLDLPTDSSLTLDDLSVTGGQPSGSVGGAAIYAHAGMLDLERVRIFGTNDNLSGGAILSSGATTLTDVELRGNNAFRGSAIYSSGTVEGTGVSIVGNSANAGGGGPAAYLANGGRLSLTRSTISGNSCNSCTSGGLEADMRSSLSLESSTVTGNYGPALRGAVTLRNTIIGPSGYQPSCSETVVTSLGSNIDAGSTCNLTGLGDRSNTAPLLAPLGDNGGPTPTHTLLVGPPASPAIDSGAATCPETDQRGVPAPQGDACDVGAVELDPSLPAASVSDADATEGDSGSTPMTFTVTLSKPSSSRVNVSFETVDDTADGNDYGPTAGTVSFAPGQTSATIDVDITGDTAAEGDETFTLQLDGARGANLANDAGTGTIHDNDGARVVSDGFGVLQGARGHDHEGTAVAGLGDVGGDAVRDVLSGAPGTTAGGTAYTTWGDASPTTRDLARIGSTTAGYAVTSPTSGAQLGSAVANVGDIDGDGKADALVGAPGASRAYVIGSSTHGVRLEIDGASGDQVGADVAAAGDVNHDGRPDLLVGAPAANDGAGVVYVIYSPATAATIDLGDTSTWNGFRVLGPRAGAELGPVGLAGFDADGLPVLLVGAPGTGAPTSQCDGESCFDGPPDQTGAVYVLSTAGVDGDIDLTQPLGYFSGYEIDGESPGDRFGSAVAGLSGFSRTTYDFAVGAPVRGGYAGAAYALHAPRRSDAPLGVGAVPRTRLTGFGEGARLGAAVAAAGDTNGDGIADMIAGASGSDSAYVVFGRDGTADEEAGRLSAADGYIIEGPGGESFGAAVGSAGDLDGDGRPELLVGAPRSTQNDRTESGATYIVYSGNGESGGGGGELPTVSIGDATVREGSSSGTTNAALPVTLSAPSETPVTVHYATGGGTASAPGDFAAGSGTVTFAPGQTAASVPIAVAADTLDEDDEQLSVSLSEPDGATLERSVGALTIADDDGPPPVDAFDASLVESDAGTGTLRFTVALARPSGKPVPVDYATHDETATAPSDYEATSGRLTFAPGETQRTVDVPVAGDLRYEAYAETLGLDVRTVANPRVVATALGTIVDNDAAPALSIADASAGEPASGTAPMRFTVSLVGDTDLPATVRWSTRDGSAAAGSDYDTSSGTLTFAPGERSKTVEVPVRADGASEPDETFLVALTGASDAVTSRAWATGTITGTGPAPAVRAAAPVPEAVAGRVLAAAATARAATLRVHCQATCRGTAVVRAAAHTIGRTAFRVQAGRTARVHVRFTRRARARVVAIVTLRARDAAARQVVRRVTVHRTSNHTTSTRRGT